MLQFTITKSNELLPIDQTTMALNAGCKWIEVNPSELSESELLEIIEKCKQAEVILTFLHDDALLDKHRVHGVHLAPADVEPQTLRDRLGGHPIVGIDATDNIDLKALKRADIDYLVVTDFPSEESKLLLKSLCTKIYDASIDFPIVVQGIIREDEIAPLKAAGANAFNIDINSLKGPLYEASLGAYIKECNVLNQ